jgi:hypothetical protein
MNTQKPSPKALKNSNSEDRTDETETTSGEQGEKEIGGYEDAGLPEPTRYNDWEVKGRCSDF